MEIALANAELRYLALLFSFQLPVILCDLDPLRLTNWAKHSALLTAGSPIPASVDADSCLS